MLSARGRPSPLIPLHHGLIPWSPRCPEGRGYVGRPARSAARCRDRREPVAVSSDIEHPNAALVRRHYEDLVNRGDLSSADRDVRPDFVDHAAPPGTPPGPDSVKGWISMVRAAFPDITVTEEEVIANGDMVAVLARWTGTHQGDSFGIAATGRRVELRGMVLWRVADGRLAERWAVLDYDALLAALQA